LTKKLHQVLRYFKLIHFNNFESCVTKHKTAFFIILSFHKTSFVYSLLSQSSHIFFFVDLSLFNYLLYDLQLMSFSWKAFFWHNFSQEKRSLLNALLLLIFGAFYFFAIIFGLFGFLALKRKIHIKTDSIYYSKNFWLIYNIHRELEEYWVLITL